MKNNLEININALFCKTVINLIYLLLDTLLISSILTITYYFQWIKISFLSISIIIIPVIIFTEIFRQNTAFNRIVISNVYNFIYYLFQEPFRITKLVNKILDIATAGLFVYYFFILLLNLESLSTQNHPIFQAIGIVITVSSIVLTVLFSTLQQFENKYSDFKSILQQWKTTNIFLFILLAIYTTTSFIFYFIGSNKYFDILILISSIYLVIKLILIAINISFMMNFGILLKIYERNTIKFIKSWNISNDKNLVNEITQKGVKYFIKYKVWGINKKKHYTISEQTISELQAQVEPIFRLAENFLRENNLNDFLICNKVIYNVVAIYAKLYNDSLETKFYQFLAYKIKDLYRLAVNLKYQSFPEHLVELNEQLGLFSIREKKDQTDFKTIQTLSFYAFKDNAKEFIIMAINLENTPASTLAIISFRKFINKLIFNQSIDEVSGLIDDLNTISFEIWTLNNTKKVTNNAWCVTLISYIITDIINIFYYVAMYNLQEYMSIDTTYLENKIKQAFEDSFKLLTTYKTYPSDFSIFFNNLGRDLNLKSVTEILKNSPYIMTPYKNSVYNGSSLITHYVNALDQVYNAILVYDFDTNVDFDGGLTCLSNFLDSFEKSTKILFDSDNSICVNRILESITNIQEYVFLFIERVNATNYKRKQMLEISSLLLKNLYSTFLNILKNYTISEKHQSYYIEDFVKFVFYSVKMYATTNDKNKKLIEDLIQKLFIDFEQQDVSKQKDLYDGINLIALLLCKTDRNSKIFNILCQFSIKYKPEKQQRNNSIYIDSLKENNITSFARYWINYNDIKEYHNILLEFENKES